MLIVESITDKKRVPAYGKEKIISLADVAIYTNQEDKPLNQIFQLIFEKESGKAVNIDTKDKQALNDYFTQILPDFDKDRVYPNDIKKVISWYNILVNDGMTDFSLQDDTKNAGEAETEVKNENKKPKATAAPKKAVATKKPAVAKKTAAVRKAGGNGK